MAFQRRFRRKMRPMQNKRRRKTTRRTNYKRKTTLVNHSNTVIAPRYITSMKYSDRYSLANPVAGIPVSQIWNLNSTFDPDSTGVGHQPFGRDQIASLYNRYRVFGASWRLELSPTSAPISVSVIPINGSYILSTPAAIREQPMSITKLTSTTMPTIFKGRVSLPKLTGQTPTQYKAGLEYQAQKDASPGELMTLQLYSNAFGGTPQLNYEASIVYHVEWFDPVQIAQS